MPLLLFWTLSLICLYKAIFEEKNGFILAGGIAMGLAFNSKYTAFYYNLVCWLFIFLQQIQKIITISLVLGAYHSLIAVTFPVWYWNYQNDFASFAFQSSERTSSISEFKISPKNFFGAIGHQMFLLLPVLFLVFITFTYKYVKRALLKFKLTKF